MTEAALQEFELGGVAVACGMFIWVWLVKHESAGASAGVSIVTGFVAPALYNLRVAARRSGKRDAARLRAWRRAVA